VDRVTRLICRAGSRSLQRQIRWILGKVKPSGFTEAQTCDGGMKLIRTSLFILAIGVVTSSASAAPLVKGNPIAPTHDVVNVKIVCEQYGHCYQHGRRPLARWVYGDDAFYGPGPYAGPGNYGRPGKHWAWWAFLGF